MALKFRTILSERQFLGQLKNIKIHQKYNPNKMNLRYSKTLIETLLSQLSSLFSRRKQQD